MSSDNPYSPPVPPPPPQDDGSELLSPPQAVTVSPVEEDYAAFANNLNQTDKTIRRLLQQRMVRWFVVAGIFLAASFYFGPQGENIPSLEASTRMVGIAFGVLATISIPLARWQARRRVSRSIRLGMYGETGREVRVTLEQIGVHLSEEQGEGTRYWSGVHRVAKTDDYLFIYLQPMQAAIIPLRAFQSEEQFRGFARLAENLWFAAQPKA